MYQLVQTGIHKEGKFESFWNVLLAHEIISYYIVKVSKCVASPNSYKYTNHGVIENKGWIAVVQVNNVHKMMLSF